MPRGFVGYGGARKARHVHPNLWHFVGRFETDGDAAAVNPKGIGVRKIAFLGTGQYRVELCKSFAEILFADAWVAQATSGSAAAIVLPGSLTPGDMDTPASFIVETHSALGTEANLNGPVVMFEVWASDTPTPAGHTQMTDET